MPDLEEYRRAQKAGIKEYRSCVATGQYPYPQVLDDILQNTLPPTVERLGVVDIPMHLIKGTKTEGRKTAFSRSFLPLLDEDSEFAHKWMSLCEAHLEEGIKNPITAYEFMGRFYVEEGNKRVSVLRYFGAVSIPGNVTRLIPGKTGSVESKVYQEYLEFYRCTGINYVIMTRPGNYNKLCQAVGIQPGETWTEEQKSDFYSVFYRFKKTNSPTAQEKVPTGDALVTYLEFYPYRELEQISTLELSRRLDKLRSELEAAGKTTAKAVSVQMEPQEPAAPALPHAARLLERLIISNRAPTKVAFLYEKEPQTSGWTAAHEFGRCQLGETMGDRVQTYAFPNVKVGVNDEEMVAKAIEQGCSIIFSTTPKLMKSSLKAAVEHPEIKFLNCSLSMPYPSVRTYYGRIFEAKFITGAIAGALSPDGRIGYVASSPIYGEMANINAFAIGAAMTNANAKVYLRWTCLPDQEDPDNWFRHQGITLVSHRDMRSPVDDPRQFGLYRLKVDGSREDLAAPFWHWGRYYERILEIILSQTWNPAREDHQAVNYWWGVGSGVIDLLLSRNLPPEVARMAYLLKDGIAAARISPFDMKLVDQEGTVRYEGGPMLPPEKIVYMDWLVSHVVGRIPAKEELSPEALPLAELQGIYNKESEEE